MLPLLKGDCECHSCRQTQQYAVSIAATHGGSYYGKSEWPFDPFQPSAAPMCSGGCGTHDDCSECDYCSKPDCGTTVGRHGTDSCGCDKCGECGLLAGECECCGSCGSQYCGHCYECDEHECECSCNQYDGDSYYGDGPGSFGSIKVAPWEARGKRVFPDVYTSSSAAISLWDVDDTIDLSQAAADFYLLDGLTANLLNAAGDVTGDDAFLRLLRSEAAEMRASLVSRLDRSFRGYLDMVIGGELRHHRCAGAISGGRSAAWGKWHEVRSTVGTAALEDAITLFEDFNSGGYGGSAWANIARVLLARETGKISPAVFIDRVWNLQHNGGSVFDKIAWNVRNKPRFGYYELNQWVLPAHGSRNPWTILLGVCSDEVRELFVAYWQQASRAKVAVGIRPEPMPATRIPMVKGYYGDWQVDTAKASAFLAH